MTDRIAERLDAAVEALMADTDLPSSLSPELTALLQVAAALRDLPRDSFKAELKSALRAAAGPSYGPVLATGSDIEARLAVLAGPQRLVAHDLAAALRDMPELTMRILASLDGATVVLSRFSTQSPLWERHPAGDELLHVLEGTLDVTSLTADGPVHDTVHAGSLFICRRGVWHWPRPRGAVSLLSLTPGAGSEHMHGDEPPVATDPPSGVVSRSAVTDDLATALRDLPTLAISPATTEAEADAATRTIGWLEDRMLGVVRFAGATPWERHPDGDELLHVLDGDVDVTILADDGPVQVTVPAGSVLVCPRGLWHRQRPKTTATLFFATPTATTETSWADPRV
jgi:quercetin dioxygenase-like cupin family protein